MARKIIESCPHCGSDWGIYTKIDYLRVRADYCFDGEEQFNLGDVADCAEERREGKTAYCQKCDRPICHLSTLKKQWGKGVFRLSQENEDCEVNNCEAGTYDCDTCPNNGDCIRQNE